MKKRSLLVICSAVLVSLLIIGSCFALYYKEATTKTITVSTGDKIVLQFGATTITSEKPLNPTNPSVKFSTVLQTNATGDKLNTIKEENRSARFYIKVVEGTDNLTAEEIEITAKVNPKAGSTKGVQNVSEANLINAQLGYVVELVELPESVEIDVALADAYKTDAGFKKVAEKTFEFNLHWEIIEYTIKQTATYLVGNINGQNLWTPKSDFYTLKANPDKDGELMIKGVELQAGDEFKIASDYNGTNFVTWNNNLKEAVKVAAKAETPDPNIVMKESGIYNIYVSTGGIWIEPANRTIHFKATDFENLTGAPFTVYGWSTNISDYYNFNGSDLPEATAEEDGWYKVDIANIFTGIIVKDASGNQSADIALTAGTSEIWWDGTAWVTEKPV